MNIHQSQYLHTTYIRRTHCLHQKHFCIKTIELFRNFMFDEHIRNLELLIHNYQVSIEDDGIISSINVGINEPKVLDLIKSNNRITAKDVADQLSLSLRQGERIMASLKEKGLIKRIGPNKSGHWEVIE